MSTFPRDPQGLPNPSEILNPQDLPQPPRAPQIIPEVIHKKTEQLDIKIRIPVFFIFCISS